MLEPPFLQLRLSYPFSRLRAGGGMVYTVPVWRKFCRTVRAHAETVEEVQKMKKLLIFVLGGILAAVMPLAAETEYANGYTWTYWESWDGNSVYILEVSPEPTGTVTIPSRLGGKPVTRIEANAFYGYSGMTNVTIPSGVTRIDDYAFYRCWGLESVRIPDSVSYISDSAFKGCDGLADEDGFVVVGGILFSYVGGESEIAIPDNVKRIIAAENEWGRASGGAFANCSWIESIKLPESVMSIGADAFRGCSEAIYDTTTIPGVKIVDGWAISTTGSLSGALDLTGCRVIADNAFRNCSGITSVTIPPSVKSIGDSAFDSCNGLRAVHISDLTAWLKISFSGYRSNPLRLAGHLYLNGKEVTDVVVPDGITSIDSGLFTDWDGLKSVTLPSSVRNIGYEAFDGCDGLTSVTISSSVTNIDEFAFYSCDQLKSLVIPASVKSIGVAAFAECDNLKSITFPTWCKKIKAYYDKHHEEFVLTNKTVNKKDWYPLNFVFYALVDYDDYETEDYLNYKKIVAQETRGMKITYKDVKGSGGGAVPEAWQKARTLKGKATCALPPPYNLRGAFELKCGKASKQGVAKVSATLTGIDGKKTSYKAQSVDVTGKTATVNLDGLSVTIDGDSFSGSDGLGGGLGVSTADVGGDWTRDGAKVYVDVTDLPAGTIAELLPDGEPAIPKGGKWAFNKAATVKFSKDKTKAEWDTSKGKTNLSGLKLTYTPKTGVFKGSFKLYALEGADTARKLKKYTVNVTGVVVDGKGVGQAVIKKSAADPWTVTVE